MTLVEVDRALRKLRLSGMADVLDTRLRQAQAERLPPLDKFFLKTLHTASPEHRRGGFVLSRCEQRCVAA